MKKVRGSNPSRAKMIGRQALWLALVAMSLIGVACSGDTVSVGTSSKYPPGSITMEEIERRLKFDARVEDFAPSGDELVVNVNESFVSSPAGLQEQAIGDWYAMFQASKASADGQVPKGLKVIVRHEGSDVATWTPARGFEPAHKPKSAGGASHSTS